MKKVVGKVILSIVFVALLISVILIVRKMLILSDLKRKNLKYATSSNYKLVMNEYRGNTILYKEQYKKNQKLKVITTIISEVGKDEEIKFINETRKNTYLKGWNDDKAVWLNKEVTNSEEDGIYLIFSFQITNLKQLFEAALEYKISTENCDRKECYRVKSIQNGIPVIEYIEKETGLPIRLIHGANLKEGSIIEFECEFNKVTDDCFIEPNIAEYEIVNN